MIVILRDELKKQLEAAKAALDEKAADQKWKYVSREFGRMSEYVEGVLEAGEIELGEESDNMLMYFALVGHTGIQLVEPEV